MGFVRQDCAVTSDNYHFVTGAGNDFQKDKQFQKLNAVKDTIRVKVVRAGEEVLIENLDIVVGDLLVLDTGDKIVADGVAVESFGLVVDEASLTGESEPLAKGPKEDPWCRSGTQVRCSSPSIHIMNPHVRLLDILLSAWKDQGLLSCCTIDALAVCEVFQIMMEAPEAYTAVSVGLQKECPENLQSLLTVILCR